MSQLSNVSLCVPRISKFGPNPSSPSTVAYHQVPKDIPTNHVLIRVDRFGFSANNITYQALGEVPHFRYFDFHAAPTAGDVSPESHGLTPVWGFGEVVASSHPKVQAGERIYGYLAPSRYLLLPVSPSDVNKYAFFVPRPDLPADRRPYNQLRRCATDPQYNPEVEDLTMLYRPLFWTSYWCEDWLNSSSYRGGAKLIVISSASSKTAFCLAYRIQRRIASNGIPADAKIVGLTSKGNLTFTKGLGLYHDVITYDDLTASTFPSGQKGIYVDVAGNEKLNQQMLSNYGTTFVAAIQLGMTSLSPSSDAGDSWTTNTSLDGPKNSSGPLALEQFFMPEWLAIRGRQLSIEQITSMQLEAWNELMRDCKGWVEIERIDGGDAVQKVYDGAVKSGLGPNKGYILSLWDDAEAKSKM